LCMDCSDFGHLVFLPQGDAALTRRAKKHSKLWAVVVRFSRTRKRYERRGLLVEPEALDIAELECSADEQKRAARRIANASRRSQQDEKLSADMEVAIGRLFPKMPSEEAR